MSLKSVLFDLDGTLLDTLEDLGTSLNHVLDRRGYPTHTMDAYRQFVGEGAERLVFKALPENKRHEEEIKASLHAFKREYAQHWNVKTKPYIGIKELLDELTKRRIKLAVLSNKPHEFTVKCVTELLANWTFDVVFGQRESVPRKPDPTGALEIAALLDVPLHQCVFLGDTGVDMKTAVAAGMLPVGVLWGFRSPEELKDHGAKALIQRPLDLLNLLNSDLIHLPG